jgi:hypothetical protein
MDQFEYKGKSYPVWINGKGYACVTVNENGYGKAFLLHKLVWEQANGPVPMGHEIHHLDFNRANWRLDNLVAVDRQTHQEMHRKARSTDINDKPGRKKEKNMNPDQRRPST